MGFATVADSSKPKVTMTLVDIENRFIETLREAIEKNKRLYVTNVLSRKQSEVVGEGCVLNEVVLVPSKKSVVDWEWKSDCLKNSIQSSLESETQVSPYLKHPRIIVLAVVVDIEIAGKLLNESRCLESPTSFFRGITIDNATYRQATLHLESVVFSDVPCPREVLASPSIIKTLCGGIEADEMARDGLIKTHVFDLVQALLREQVKLRWTICTRQQPFWIEQVVLPMD